MVDVLLFHHAQGLTEGFLEFAAEIRTAGHVVHTPDLFDGKVFAALEEGVAFVEGVGFGEIIARGERAAAGLNAGAVYAGFSLGVLPAQKLAQTRDGARGALLIHACIPISEFGGEWPQHVPVQIHAMEEDPFFVGDGDIDAANALVDSTSDGELFLYPGKEHLFADASLSSYDPIAARLMTNRALEFLAAC